LHTQRDGVTKRPISETNSDAEHDADRHHMHRPFRLVEADAWRTIFSRGDATLLSGHARTSLAAPSDNFHEGQHHPTKAAWVSSEPSGTIHYAPQKSNARAKLLTEKAGVRRPHSCSGRPTLGRDIDDASIPEVEAG
jgi:hypothetical protein